MVQKVLNILNLTTQLHDLQDKKDVLHKRLIETNRLVKAGQVVPEASIELKAQIATLNCQLRTLEHELSILTLTIMKTASIVETPYGRVVEYQTQEKE